MKSTSSTELPFSDKYDTTHAQAYFEKHQDGWWRKLSHWRDKKVARKTMKLAGEPTYLKRMAPAVSGFEVLSKLLSNLAGSH